MKIEFFGPPGCGKTYITEKLTGVSRSEIRAKATSPILSKIKQLSRYSPVSIMYRRKIRKLLMDVELKPVYHDTDVRTMVDSIVLVATTYKMNLKSKNILDEGLVQRIISFSVNYNLSEAKTVELVAMFEDLLQTIKVVSIELPVASIIDSIKDRGRKESKMDYFEEEVLETFVQQYVHLCSVLTKRFGFESITRDDFDRFIEENKKI